MKNAEELIEEFERGGVEVRRQEKIEKRKEEDEYRRMELLEKYMARVLYGWDDKKFEEVELVLVIKEVLLLKVNYFINTYSSIWYIT